MICDKIEFPAITMVGRYTLVTYSVAALTEKDKEQGEGDRGGWKGGAGTSSIFERCGSSVGDLHSKQAFYFYAVNYVNCYVSM